MYVIMRPAAVDPTTVPASCGISARPDSLALSPSTSSKNSGTKTVRPIIAPNTQVTEAVPIATTLFRSTGSGRNGSRAVINLTTNISQNAVDAASRPTIRGEDQA